MLRFFRAGPEPSPAQPRSKRERRPATAAEIATWRLGEARNRRHRIQNGLKIDIQLLMPALPKIPSRILGHCLTLTSQGFFPYELEFQQQIAAFQPLAAPKRSLTSCH
jgi:hypothetical protein